MHSHKYLCGKFTLPTPTMKHSIATTTCTFFLAVTGVFLILVPQQADAYAAWFVDRRASCFTELVPDEIVMNNKILHHSKSIEPGVHLDISPLESNKPSSSEYAVKFVLPQDTHLNDVQYVIQLRDPEDFFEDAELPAKFTSAPTNGGIGCGGARAHGRARMEDSPAIVTFNDGVKDGARIEVWAGWATGHEAVSLTEKVVIVAGRGVNGQHFDDFGEFDDYLYDDMIAAELEEEDIEAEREEIEKEIEFAEEDAVEALEEKRIETEGMGSVINEAEEEVVEALEANRKDANKALNELKDEIILKQKEHAQNHQTKIDEAKRKQAQKKHHDRHPDLEDMERRFKDGSEDPRKEKLRDVLDIKDNLEESIEQLKKNDMKEHSNAKRRHIKPLPKEELKIDMQELKHKLKQKLNVGKLKEKLGVNELFESKEIKMLRGKLKEGIPRGGESVYHAEKGAPLPPEGKHFLFIMFSFFIIVGFARWFLDKRRRSNKGRRVN
mmetsp:Transcript_18944/g.28297  ORF Transcript_18944/g.28297 Transcript_18944/m.28297 type:complete len:496 (+) Transcript_18944:8-1495(+)